MRLLLRLIASCLLTLLLSPFMSSAAFRDVPSLHQYRDAIEYFSEQGLIEGYLGGNYFQPENRVTRAEFIKMLVSWQFSAQEIKTCLNSYYSKNWTYVRFPDVATSEWFAPYVCVAFDAQIINGYADGTFQPHQNISFVEAAKIGVETANIAVQKGGEWYEPFVRLLETEKAIPPTVSTFTSLVRRGEVAEMLYRLDRNITHKPFRRYVDLVAAQIPCDRCLVIPRLNIEVPIVFGAAEDALVSQDWSRLEREILNALRGGVVHYPGTALPGQKGNNFITGHSSYYSGDTGKYNYIFSKLEALQIGDEYIVYYNGESYRYQIRDSRIVWPNNTEVLYQPHDQEISSLMTCWPPGTNLKRIVFTADRIL